MSKHSIQQSVIYLALSLVIPPCLFWLMISGLYPWVITEYSNITHIKLNLSPFSHTTEWVILTFLYLLVWVVSARSVFALCSVLVVFGLFLALNLVKISYLYAPLLPTDFSQLRELIQSEHLFSHLLPWAIVTCVLVIAGLLFSLRFSARNLPRAPRVVLGLTLLAMLFSLWMHADAVQTELRKKGIFYKKNSNLVVHYLTKGMATSFLQIWLFSDQYDQPDNYSRQTMEHIVSKHRLNSPAKQQEPVNVIILMIESLTRPGYYGWQTNNTATKTLNQLHDAGLEGSVYSPVYGGKSINAEFELLTGMSTYFTTPESLVYREALHQPTPSLASHFRQMGYHTLAMRDEPIDTYGFSKVYEWLGFNDTHSFTGNQKPTDPTGKYSSSRVIADKIIEEVEANSPAFVFTFTMSTHAPWNGKDYNNNLDFIYPANQPSTGIKNQLKGYLNAVDHMDQGIARLIEHFSSSDEKTVILITGDHQPHINTYHQQFTPSITQQDLVPLAKKHQLPFYLWSNFEPPQELITEPVSMNHLPLKILSLLGSQPCGLLKFVQSIEHKAPVFGKLMNQNLLKDPSFNQLMDEFELLHYDIIYGENHLADLLSGQCLNNTMDRG